MTVMTVIPENVKISYNKPLWNHEGTYYRGCFTMSKPLFERFQAHVRLYMKRFENKTRFTSEEMKELVYLPNLEIVKERSTGRDCVFLKLTQRAKLVDFLMDEGICVNLDRALGKFNYYIEIR